MSRPRAGRSPRIAAVPRPATSAARSQARVGSIAASSARSAETRARSASATAYAVRAIPPRRIPASRPNRRSSAAASSSGS